MTIFREFNNNFCIMHEMLALQHFCPDFENEFREPFPKLPITPFCVSVGAWSGKITLNFSQNSSFEIFLISSNGNASSLLYQVYQLQSLYFELFVLAWTFLNLYFYFSQSVIRLFLNKQTLFVLINSKFISL